MLPHATASPREALERVRRGDLFDIAILDRHLSELDGITLAREIRHWETERRREIGD